MEIELIPAAAEQLETLIAGADAFLAAYGLQVVDGYLPFPGVLQYSLNAIAAAQIWHPWLPYLFVVRPDRALVGLGGFKSVPDRRTVEIGYAIAPSYQGRGFATSAARQLIEIAWATGLVDCVCAHTLAEPNASTRVLANCGMTQVAEILDPEDGKIWRWELQRIKSH